MDDYQELDPKECGFLIVKIMLGPLQTTLSSTIGRNLRLKSQKSLFN